jgi:hypothetical protein
MTKKEKEKQRIKISEKYKKIQEKRREKAATLLKEREKKNDNTTSTRKTHPKF